MAVEQSQCPSRFQELTESGPPESEAATVSRVVTRTKRLPQICSILVIFVVWAAATVRESVWKQVSIQDAFFPEEW